MNIWRYETVEIDHNICSGYASVKIHENKIILETPFSVEKECEVGRVMNDWFSLFIRNSITDKITGVVFVNCYSKIITVIRFGRGIIFYHFENVKESNDLIENIIKIRPDRYFNEFFNN